MDDVDFHKDCVDLVDLCGAVEDCIICGVRALFYRNTKFISRQMKHTTYNCIPISHPY